MSNVNIKITSSDSATETRKLLTSGAKNNLSEFLAKAGTGTASNAAVQLANDNAVAASGTVTMAFAHQTDGDTIQIGATILTARTSPSTTNEFAIGASDAASATALAAAIILYSGGLIHAQSSGAVVTVRAMFTGTLGNAIPIILTQSDAAGMVASGSALSGGLADTAPFVEFRKF